MKRKNAGFSLVELLVSVAVLSIVTLGIGGLLKLAAEQYSNATKETEVQNLLQSTVASISNSLEDVAIDVTFEAEKKRLIIINQEDYLVFELQGSALYYDVKQYPDTANDDAKKKAEANKLLGTDLTYDSDVNLLADHVTVFSVDTSTKAQGFVVLNVTIQYQERVKNLTQNVFMRNLKPKKVVINTETKPTGQTPSSEEPSGEEPSGEEPSGEDETITYTSSASFEDNKLLLNFSNGKKDNSATIAKTTDGKYILYSDSVPWLLNQDNMKMPGYDANKTVYVLNDQQIKWLKDKNIADLAATSFTNSEYPYIPKDTALQGVVFDSDASKTTLQMGDWMWEGNASEVAISCDSSLGKPFRVIIEIDGTNDPKIDQISGGNGRYSHKPVDGKPGQFEIWFSVNWSTELDSEIKPIIKVPLKDTSNVSVKILSMDVYKE